jgi:hypothetical protein
VLWAFHVVQELKMTMLSTTEELEVPMSGDEATWRNREKQ